MMRMDRSRYPRRQAARYCRRALAILTPALWILLPLVVFAQPLPASLARSLQQGDVLTIYGRVYEEDGITPWADGDTIVVTNRRTSEQCQTIQGNVEPGWYGVTFVEFRDDSALAVDDYLDFALLRWRIQQPSYRVVREEDLAARQLRFDLKVGSLDQTGACCLSDWECVVVPEAECWDRLYLGHGSVCDPNPCPAAGIDDLGTLGISSVYEVRPSPFREKVAIRYRVSVGGPVSLRVFDAGGRRVRELITANRASGVYMISWDGRDGQGIRVPSGLYFVMLVARDGVSSRPVVHLE